MKIIIAGGRNFNDYNKLRQICDDMLQNHYNIEVVSGSARGADRLGEIYAKERNFKLMRFPAAWSKFGNSAGIIGNVEMAKYADVLIAFWDHKSKGTGHMIRLAEKEGLKVSIHYY